MSSSRMSFSETTSPTSSNPLLSRSLPAGLQMEEYYLLGRHPFLSGMMQFKLQLIFQGLGLALPCAWGIIMCLSHLYEAGN